jgi:hypothetical protein
MTMSDSLAALRRANPRGKDGFDESVHAAAEAVRDRIGSYADDEGQYVPSARRPRLLRVSLAAASLALAAAAALVGISSQGGAPAVESAAAAIRKAAHVSASSAEHSGTAVVRITRGAELWAASTVRWHEDDLFVSHDAPLHALRAGSKLLLVDGTMYGLDPFDGGWVELGSPASIDPGSGTTPADYLGAVRADVGGATLRRIIDGVTGLTTRRLEDGSIVYSGKVAAGLIARETGFKEGRTIRILPFGYVAHDEAAEPAAPLHVAVKVGADGVVRELAVTWGAARSQWRYVVTYRSLGATPAPVAPDNARSLRERMPTVPPEASRGN